jgi:hypothetical protein
MSAAVGRVHGRYDFAFVNQHLLTRFQGCAAPRTAGVGKPLHELTVLGIAKIETLMPIVRSRKVGACHYRLGFTRLKGKSGGAFRLDNGCDGGFAIHFHDG